MRGLNERISRLEARSCLRLPGPLTLAMITAVARGAPIVLTPEQGATLAEVAAEAAMPAQDERSHGREPGSPPHAT